MCRLLPHPPMHTCKSFTINSTHRELQETVAGVHRPRPAAGSLGRELSGPGRGRVLQVKGNLADIFNLEFVEYN